MPTVVVEEGFEIRVLTRNEHRPAHVHVYKAGAECRIFIESATLWDIKGGMTARDARQAEALVRKYQNECQAAWRTYNGHL